jgi:hypothetical protein
MPEERFKLPGSSYSQLVKIIRAYGHASDNVAPKAVADRAAVDQTEVSRNNGFLVSVGILEGGKTKSLTSKGRSLAHALDLELPSETERGWRQVAEENEFLQKIVSAVRIRSGMDPTALKGHIAFSAGQPKKSRALIGAGSIVELLTAAGLVKELDGKVVATQVAERDDRAAPGEPDPARKPARPTELAVYPEQAVPPSSRFSVSIRVNVTCPPDQLADLGPQLKALLSSLEVTDGDVEDE